MPPNSEGGRGRLTGLPMDARLDDVVSTLKKGRNLVITAEPGAGKTTRVPPALLDGGIGDGRQIVVVQPRRIAARLAAVRVAEEQNETLGGRVGYQVRFEDVTSRDTRIRYVTEGILLRRLNDDPTLGGVGAVVLDEFHERHLTSDLLLSLLRRLQLNERRDLRLVVMSATLDAGPVARYLDGEVVEVPGRLFAVQVEHIDHPDKRPLERQVAAAVNRLCGAGTDGDILVFLPGAAEIRRAGAACEPVAAKHGLALAVLHGDLSLKDQDFAVRRGPKNKIILSTNVAESSITVPGVTAVVDSGLARVARYAPWSGLRQLVTASISKASAAQRAGRAGRVRPGRALRLYTKHEFNTRPDHQLPEIQRADLSETVLFLRAGGYGDPRTFPFFDPPPADAVDAAETSLCGLGALEPGSGNVTALGRQMAALPLHPRLGKITLEAHRRSVGRDGCLLSALLQEREIRTQLRTRLGDGNKTMDRVAPSDALARMEAFQLAEQEGFNPRRVRALGLDPAAVRAVSRARDQIARAVRARPAAAVLMNENEIEQALMQCVLAGFPDRVGRRRKDQRDEVVFAQGGSATLSPVSVVKEAEFMVAPEVERNASGHVIIRVASAIEPEWLMELFPDRVVARDTLRFNARTRCVEQASSLSYAALVLHEEVRTDVTGPEVSAVLERAVRDSGLGAICDTAALEQLRNRVAFAAAHVDGLMPITDGVINSAVGGLCRNRRCLDAVRKASLVDTLRHEHVGRLWHQVEKVAPDTVAIPGRRRVKVRYEPGRPPWIASRLQDFFGSTRGPAVANGRVPLTLHLNAPNNRAVQVTADLASFWKNHYPAIRRELMRRYPKHSWPEDPLTARAGV